MFCERPVFGVFVVTQERFYDDEINGVFRIIMIGLLFLLSLARPSPPH